MKRYIYNIISLLSRRRFARRAACMAAVAAMLMPMLTGTSSCTIEPPLHLAGTDLQVKLAEVVTDIDVVWDIDVDWRHEWYYGWDDEDSTRWGTLDYPDPKTYEVRIYHYGLEKASKWLYNASLWASSNIIRRRYDLGWHDLLIWSDVITYDQTQAVIFDESDPDNIGATTSRTNLSFELPGSRSSLVYNNPEIFYSGLERDFYVSADTADYDYYDPVRNVWVKEMHTQISPMVYIYLVQVIIHNNNGRITGLNADAAMTSMASGVSLHTGTTTDNDIVVAFPMRMKKDLAVAGGKRADVLGSKFTTFGLCGMMSWHKSRASQYNGTHPELKNYLSLDFSFRNSTDSSFAFDVTNQLQSQCHGGVIVVEVDADTIKIPSSGGGGKGGTFKPTVENYKDSVIHNIEM